MKKAVIIEVLLLISVFCSCVGNNNSPVKIDLNSDSIETTVQSDTICEKLEFDKGFSIQLPPEMEEMELNPEASMEVGWVEKEGGELKEMYAVVLVETKAEIDSFSLDFEFDAMSYRDISVESLGSSLEEYKVLTNEPKVENVNGMDCVITETRGEMQVNTENNMTDYLGVYYILAVFEGENAFYQVLVWCIESQKYYFKDYMLRIIYSFEEAPSTV